MKRAIVLAVLLAGCLGADAPVESAALTPGDAVDDVLPATPASPSAASADVPVWSVGDAWAISTMGDASENAFVVVTQADDTGYTLATTSASMAGFDAMFDVSYLGRIRASDLAGSQQDTPVQFFSFPLADGKTWSTPWDGGTVELTATATPNGFAIVGTMDGAPHVEYDYVPELRWWSHIHFAAGYGLKVARAETNWTGTLATATANLVYESTTAVPVATINSERFAISEGQTYAALTFFGGSSAYARALLLMDPAGQPYMTSTSNAEWSAEPSGIYYHERLPATPGEWSISAPVVHEQDGHFELRVHEVLEGTVAFP